MQTPYEASLHEKTALQVGGDHYEKMGVQPADFWMANDYDADAGMILKYMSRHKRKAGKEDVLKARSFVQIRLNHRQFIMRPRWSTITMREYVNSNNLEGNSGDALYALDYWVHSGYGECTFHLLLLETIDRVLAADYPS